MRQIKVTNLKFFEIEWNFKNKQKKHEIKKMYGTLFFNFKNFLKKFGRKKAKQKVNQNQV